MSKYCYWVSIRSKEAMSPSSLSFIHTYLCPHLCIDRWMGTPSPMPTRPHTQAAALGSWALVWILDLGRLNE